jgi:hypothetical protein
MTREQHESEPVKQTSRAVTWLWANYRPLPPPLKFAVWASILALLQVTGLMPHIHLPPNIAKILSG